jgi:hypothetical protein
VAGASVDLYQNLIPGKGVAFLITAHFLKGMGTMRNKRFQFSDRRLDENMPRVTFKDSNGATIKGCRRKIPDRRIGNIQVEWIDDVVIH